MRAKRATKRSAGVRWWVAAAFVVVIATAIAAVVFSGAREYRRASAIDREIAALRAEAERLEQRNAALEDRMRYIASDAYKSYVAKDRLGYRQANERVIIVRGAPSVSPSAQPPTPVSERSGWLERLFGK